MGEYRCADAEALPSIFPYYYRNFTKISDRLKMNDITYLHTRILVMVCTLNWTKAGVMNSIKRDDFFLVTTRFLSRKRLRYKMTTLLKQLCKVSFFKYIICVFLKLFLFDKMTFRRPC